MNINLKFLLCGAAVGLLPQYAAAQCAITDCQQLGYTSLKSCDGGLKCPFGEYWACPQKQCDASYQYACTGANEQPGTDKCGDKYKACTCASGYEWKDSKCKEKLKPILGQCTGYAKNCSIGQILNSDGTCTTDKENGKTPIGVVVYISGGSDKCGYAMTASLIATSIRWSVVYDNTGAFQSSNWQNAITDFDVSGNMTKIIQTANDRHGDNAAKFYPAAYAALNYAPSAAPTSKGKWALPTAGILNSLHTNLDAINNAISKVGGTQFTGHNECIWSSSEYDYISAWVLCVVGSGAYWSDIRYSNKRNEASDNVFRPVIAF